MTSERALKVWLIISGFFSIFCLALFLVIFNIASNLSWQPGIHYPKCSKLLRNGSPVSVIRSSVRQMDSINAESGSGSFNNRDCLTRTAVKFLQNPFSTHSLRCKPYSLSLERFRGTGQVRPQIRLSRRGSKSSPLPPMVFRGLEFIKLKMILSLAVDVVSPSGIKSRRCAVIRPYPDFFQPTNPTTAQPQRSAA
jgi:hypothetical protein